MTHVMSAKIDTTRLHSVRWHSTMDGRIASQIVGFSTSGKHFVNFDPVTPDWPELVANVHGVQMAKILYGLIFTRHSLGGSSIVCL